MSIDLENPQTVLGQVDAAANYVAQIWLALMIGDKAHALTAVSEAERLLCVAIEGSENDESVRREALTALGAAITNGSDEVAFNPFVLLAHRILATGEPDGIPKTPASNDQAER